MIEVGGLPCRGVVTILTSLREPHSDVVGIGCIFEIRQVTTDAIGRSSLVSTVQVTGGAVETGMSARQSKSRYSQVIEGGAQPGCDLMALLTTGRETSGDVIGPGRLLIGGLVAGVTLK